MTFKYSYARVVLVLTGLVSIIGMSLAYAAEPTSQSTSDSVLQFSKTNTRARSMSLDGTSISGSVYVFARPVAQAGTGVKSVFFFLDHKGPYNIPYPWMQDSTSPYDYMSSPAGTTPRPADSRTVPDGTHSVTARVNYKNGTYKIHTAVFTVDNIIVDPPVTHNTVPTTPVTVPATPPDTAPATVPPTTPPTIPFDPTQKAGFSLRWNDEFNGSTLDTSKWAVYPWTLSYERSCFTAENVTISSGMLDIRTSQDGKCGKPYSSGYIRNTSLPGQLVSPLESSAGILRIEMRAQMPKWQKGIWPGLWSRNDSGEPLYGEVDLIEQWGNEASAAVVVSTSHFTKAGTHTSKKFTASSPLDQGMHTYATELDINNGGAVRYYFDDQLIATHSASSIAGLTQENFLTMLKGKWDARVMVQNTGDQQGYAGGGRDDSIPLIDTHMKVDWVRYYLKN